MKLPISLLLCSLLTHSACSNKSDDSKSPDTDEIETYGEKTTITLKDLNNLKIDVSEGVEPSKMGSDILLMSMDESFTLAEATDTNPKTLEAAKTVATERDQGSKLVGESIDGGWALRYEKDRDDGKITYYLFARRDVDGKAYFCQTSVGFKSLRDGALAACKTLRK